MKRCIAALALALAVTAAGPVHAGELVSDDIGVRCQEEDGTWLVGWFQDGDGSWYYFDEHGYAKTRWLFDGGRRYYLREGSGKLITGRTAILDGEVYRFDEDGAATRLSDLYHGWVQDDIAWYYRLSDGELVKGGWKEVDGLWYHFDAEGRMETGFVTVDGIQYYLDGQGAMVHDDTRLIDGITYSFDSSGAGTAIWPYKMPLSIPSEEDKTEFHRSVDAMADAVLARIVNDGMGQREKAVAIYRWVKGNLRYSGYSPVGDWVGAAYDGLKKRHGDCYTYYATSAELLNRAGMQTIEVIRSTDSNHFWNLVNIDGQWYHFDPCPRRTGGDFCLLTDAQLAGRSSHIFDHSLYPPTP